MEVPSTMARSLPDTIRYLDPDPRSRLPAFFDIRRKSLIRGNLLVGLSVVAAAFLSDFPHNRATLWLAIPALTVLLGTGETVRCIRKRWSFYHAGVLLCIYMDLMAVALILFFLVYPFSHFLTSSS